MCSLFVGELKSIPLLISTLLPLFCGKSIVHKEFNVMHSSCLVDKTKCCHPFTLLYLLSAFCQVWLELDSYTYTNPFPLFMFHWKCVAWSWYQVKKSRGVGKMLFPVYKFTGFSCTEIPVLSFSAGFVSL